MGSMVRRREDLQKKFGLDDKKANAVASCIETLNSLGDAMSNATWEWTSEGNLPEMMRQIRSNLKMGQDALMVLELELKDLTDGGS